MTYFLIIILALIILLIIQLFYFAKREKNMIEFFNDMLDSEKAYYQTEREKLLDRLMARNFEELKNEQAKEKTEPTEEEPDDLIPLEEMGDQEWRNVEGEEK